MNDKEVAVVTGANRGLGREVARQLAARGYSVVLATRDLEAGERTAREDGSGRALQLDIADPESVAAFADRLRDEFGHLDVLVNSAAIEYDTDQGAADADLERVERALSVNVLGAWRTTVALAPLLRSGGRVVNVSSGAGSFAETNGGGRAPAYSVSKAALNMLTVKLAADLRGRALVNAACPGWVSTDMGGPGGRPVEDGAAGIVWAAALSDGTTGGFFRDGQPVPW